MSQRNSGGQGSERQPPQKKIRGGRYPEVDPNYPASELRFNVQFGEPGTQAPWRPPPERPFHAPSAAQRRVPATLPYIQQGQQATYDSPYPDSRRQQPTTGGGAAAGPSRPSTFSVSSMITETSSPRTSGVPATAGSSGQHARQPTMSPSSSSRGSSPEHQTVAQGKRVA